MFYAVSYQLKNFPNLCGNQTFETIGECREYISHNRWQWKSHSILYTVCETLSGWQMEVLE